MLRENSTYLPWEILPYRHLMTLLVTVSSNFNKEYRGQTSIEHNSGLTHADILSRVKEAMKPRYSRLLINENVIPSTGAWWETWALDLTTMAVCSATKRTEANWYDPIEKKAGLKIVKVWSGGRGVESLIEAKLA
jgi:hypothetical protein